MKDNKLALNFYRPDHYLRYPVVIESASGTNIKDIKGKDYLDFFAAMGTVSCGHTNPVINQVLVKQINKIWASSFFPTDVQLQSIEKINSILPADLDVVSLYSTGAEAVEQAIRLARAVTGGSRIISFRDHYHGKTQGTMYLNHYYPECYGPMPDSYSTVIDSDGTDGPGQVEEYLSSVIENDVAAVIFEPVIGYSGPRRLHKDIPGIIRRLCDDNNVVMIADEILTGFHRCGRWFFSCHEGIRPDIIVFGKGLGNGYPISGVACNDSITGFMKQALPGSTFAGNSLGCAIACTVIDFMKEQNFHEKTRMLEGLFYDFFSDQRFQDIGITLDGIGGLLSISFEGPANTHTQDIYIDILREGVITSHTSTSLRIMPPLTIALGEFERGLEVISKCIYKYAGTGTRK